jgi:phage-related protein
MNARDYVNVVAAVVTADNTVWLLITTTAALVAGAASGWISARFRQREARQERIREEVLRWTNPILGAVEGLESRLDNILSLVLSKALNHVWTTSSTTVYTLRSILVTPVRSAQPTQIGQLHTITLCRVHCFSSPSTSPGFACFRSD